MISGRFKGYTYTEYQNERRFNYERKGIFTINVWQ